MSGGGGFDPMIGALNTALNLRQLNQGVIAGNIANADTPGYKAQKLEFEEALRTAMGTSEQMHPVATHTGHQTPRETDPIHPMVVDEANGNESLDGNTVDRSAEMARMSENQLLYDAAAELLKRKLNQLDYAITEGGGNK